MAPRRSMPVPVRAGMSRRLTREDVRRDGVAVVSVRRIDAAADVAATDRVVTEEPLEVRLDGHPFATIMRTPGADRELTAGFLLAEGIIASADDLGTIRHCVDAGATGSGNVVNVTLTGDAARRLPIVLDGRRTLTSTSSCGVCGRRSIDDLLDRLAPISSDLRTTRATVAAFPERLRDVQALFDDTGGVHAAALFDGHGTLVAHAEDVGRHNAVDKVIGGQLLRDVFPLGARVLFVSGRTSFEIVQKAAMAGIPIVASVSAPSSLAVDLARDVGITLIGFVRGASFNVYTGEERLEI